MTTLSTLNYLLNIHPCPGRINQDLYRIIDFKTFRGKENQELEINIESEGITCGLKLITTPLNLIIEIWPVQTKEMIQNWNK